MLLQDIIFLQFTDTNAGVKVAIAAELMSSQTGNKKSPFKNKKVIPNVRKNQ